MIKKMSIILKNKKGNKNMNIINMDMNMEKKIFIPDLGEITLTRPKGYIKRSLTKEEFIQLIKDEFPDNSSEEIATITIYFDNSDFTLQTVSFRKMLLGDIIHKEE